MPYSNTPVASASVPYLPTGAAGLAVANDAIQIQLSSTNPPDSTVKFTVSGSAYTGASVIAEKCYTATEYAANTWTTLTGVSRLDTGAIVNGTLALTDGSTLDLQASIQGLYAVRLRLTAISTNSVIAEGATFPGSGTAPVVVSSTTYGTVSAGLTMIGTTGTNTITVPVTEASAFSITDGTNTYFSVNSTAVTVIVGKALKLTDAITITNTANATGTSLWGASDKGAFFGATPVVIPANTVDYVTNLTSLGLRASGGTASATFPGKVLSTLATGGIGYATGAGSTVAQITTRTTSVTINAVTGTITLVSAAGSPTAATFTVSNSAVAATDTIVVSQKTGTDAYSATVSAVAGSSFKITIVDLTGTTTEAPAFNFTVIKGVAA